MRKAGEWLLVNLFLLGLILSACAAFFAGALVIQLAGWQGVAATTAWSINALFAIGAAVAAARWALRELNRSST